MEIVNLKKIKFREDFPVYIRTFCPRVVAVSVCH